MVTDMKPKMQTVMCKFHGPGIADRNGNCRFCENKKGNAFMDRLNEEDREMDNVNE